MYYSNDRELATRIDRFIERKTKAYPDVTELAESIQKKNGTMFVAHNLFSNSKTAYSLRRLIGNF